MSYENQIKDLARQIQEAAADAFARVYNNEVFGRAERETQTPEERERYVEEHTMRHGDEDWEKAYDGFQYLNEFFSSLADITTLPEGCFGIRRCTGSIP